MVPVSACSTPEMILMSVDLPAPFSPTSACTRPAWIVISALRMARTAPKLLEIPRSARRGASSTVIVAPLSGGAGGSGTSARPPGDVRGSVVELVHVVLGDRQRRA